MPFGTAWANESPVSLEVFPLPMEEFMKRIIFSLALGSLIATVAAAQTPRYTVTNLRPLLAFGAGFGTSNEDPTFTTIDFPGSSFTEAFGISPSGDIVGDYQMAGVFHGYLLRG